MFQSKRKEDVENAPDYLEQFSILILNLDEDSALQWGRLYRELKSNTPSEAMISLSPAASSLPMGRH
jgi:predicted nucleic acid-binding protein